MDKNAIKKFAIWARRELISRVSQKAERYGITEQEVISEHAESIHGVVLSPAQVRQRQSLLSLVRRDGYQQAMEEVAYTWFNRFIALRFMEVNDYLPNHIRPFTDDQNVFRPKLLSDALNLELKELDMDRVIRLKEENKPEELYQYLIITLCNHLSGILPGMFQRIDDYTELLFPEHLLREGSVLERMVADIPEDDWKDAIQIIGWLYQYYNAEPKDELINARKQYKKDDIPFVTQLFTPDWIVRYMVENSLGRLWIEGHPNDTLKANWDFYLENNDIEDDIQEEFRPIRAVYAKLKPDDIRCIDPCMGSGHILVYMFDVLIQIYEDFGYPTRDAVASVVQNNLWGLDIDDRASQLAYFSIMMKARQYDKGWFRRGIEPNVFALKNSLNVSEEFHFVFGELADAAKRLIDSFREAKLYGSLIQPNVTIEEVNQIEILIEEEFKKSLYGNMIDSVNIIEMSNVMLPLIQLARTLLQRYDIVITNPPYMGLKYMPDQIKRYVTTSFSIFKSDLFAVFIQKCRKLCKSTGQMAFLCPYVWMFIQSFEDMRKYILSNTTFSSLIQLEYNAFEAACVPVASFTLRNYHIDFPFQGIKLSEFKGSNNQEPRAREAVKRKDCGYRFTALQNYFEKIPGMPIAFWVNNKVIDSFSSTNLNDKLVFRQGMTTTDNEKYLRFWFEVSNNSIGYNIANRDEAVMSKKIWFPYQKGGEYRKWYGNNVYVVYYYDDGKELIELVRNKYPRISDPEFIIKNRDWYFKKGFTWSTLSSSSISIRYVPQGYIFDAKGSMAFAKENDSIYTYISLINSRVTQEYLDILAPTLDFNIVSLKGIPFMMNIDKCAIIQALTLNNIEISKVDWDSFETSWDFQVHPLIAIQKEIAFGQFTESRMRDANKVEKCFEEWKTQCGLRFDKLKANEEELNRIFIDIYGLQDELTPEVAEKDVTVRKADLSRDIRSLISYAVGCMLGRYSLDKPGLAYAGGNWDPSQYVSYPADHDGILPITDDEYFSDDIVSMFVNWVRTVYGAESLEENLKFITSALYPSAGGSSRELLRQYFLNDFYKDHTKIYQKRPIYWLFDSGKKNGFKCLIYLHRYRPDTIARIRTDYVHEMQARYHTVIEDLAHRVDVVSGSERVRLQKQLQKLQAQEDELLKYEEKIHHYADMMLPLDLDDGVKVNYAKLADVLAPIK